MATQESGARTFDLSVVTPEGAAYEGEAEMLIVPGDAGEIGVLARHAPLVAMLRAGEIRVRRGNDWQTFAAGPGYFTIKQDRAVVLVDDAVRAEDIDVEQARREVEEARALVEQAERDFRELVRVQEQAGLDLVSDGMLGWQDLFRPLADAAEGLEARPLTRFLDTNSFYRAVLVEGEPRLRSPLEAPDLPEGRWVGTLPSPFSFSRAADGSLSARDLARAVVAPQIDAWAEAGCAAI